MQQDVKSQVQGYTKQNTTIFYSWQSWTSSRENCSAGEILEHPIVEYDRHRETRRNEPETTEFHGPVQVRDRVGRAAGRENRSADLPRTRHYRIVVLQVARAFFERATDIFVDQRGPQRDEQAERIAELERLAGKQALEIEILKKAGSLLGSMRERNGR